MTHAIHRVTSCQIVGRYTLRVGFDDATHQVIDLEPMLHGKRFAALRDPEMFNQVRIDPEVHTLTWPNGADFDPATLHDWPQHAHAMEAMARGRTSKRQIAS